MINFIEIKNLNKKYGDHLVVNNLNLTIKKGTFFSFLGPNGAGKSTTINILSTIIPFSSGTITIDGLEVGKKNMQIRKKIGIVFQENVLDDCLTVEENLIFWGGVYGMEKCQVRKKLKQLEAVIDLNHILNRFFGTLSGGQKRSAEIARAIIHSPELLILDEPTTGLDPKTRIDVWKMVDYLRKNYDITVFLTTHYMEEAAQSETIAVINQGQLLTLGTPNDLKNNYSSDVLILYNKNIKKLSTIFQQKDVPFVLGNDFIKISLSSSLNAVDLLKELEGHYQSFEVLKGNLDDAFINMLKGDKKNDISYN